MPDAAEMRWTGTDWMPWSEVHPLLRDWTCAWVDLAGVHVGSAPEGPPVGSTHLWAWNAVGRLARVRIDGKRAVLGFLSEDGDGVPVPISRGRASSWDAAHVTGGAVAGRTWEVVDVLDEHTTTFLRLLDVP